MERNRVFGGKCYESLASYDQELSCWRMSQLSLFEEDVRSLDRLPKSGIVQSGQLFPLETLELRICADDGLRLPTPTAVQIESEERTNRAMQLAIEGKPLYTRRIVNGKKVAGKRTFGIKDAIIHQALLPTPTASQDYKPIRRLTPSERAGTHGKSLVGAIGEMMLPTPTAHLAKEAGSPSEYTRKSPTLITHFQKRNTGERQVLQPRFVEWMMGFPIGWTDLEP